MAKFRDMHRFVETVRNYNLEQEKDDILRGFAEDEPHMLWMKRNEAIDDFTGKTGNRDRASEVYEDTVKFKYIDPYNPNTPHMDKYLRVTPDGRHFLERGGLWRAWSDNNKSGTTIIISIIGGFITGVGVVVAIIAL